MLRHRERERDRDSDRNRESLRYRPDDDRRESRHDQGRSPSSGGNGSSSRLSGAKAVRLAKAHLAELTGRAAEGVSAVTRTRDGWRVVLDIVELERIPRTTDILASYAVDLDARGDLMAYQRIARFYRSDVDGER